MPRRPASTLRPLRALPLWAPVPLLAPAVLAAPPETAEPPGPDPASEAAPAAEACPLEAPPTGRCGPDPFAALPALAALPPGDPRRDGPFPVPAGAAPDLERLLDAWARCDAAAAPPPWVRLGLVRLCQGEVALACALWAALDEGAVNAPAPVGGSGFLSVNEALAQVCAAEGGQACARRRSPPTATAARRGDGAARCAPRPPRAPARRGHGPARR